ncbi:MAG: hypothetical protein CMJ18_14995 [Phycisphaeraceae bacterium]|nr:hypothetical protein [Phycisphaeraceae bacterium]
MLHCIHRFLRDPRRRGRRRPDVALLDPLEPRLYFAVDLLPDLTPWVSQTRSYLLNPSIDQNAQPGQTLLRFTTATANIGAEAMQLRADPKEPDGSQNLYQQIFVDENDDGQKDSLREVPIDQAKVFDDHWYFRFGDYAEYNLREYISDTEAGAIVSQNHKDSFCLVDSTSFNPLPNDVPNVGVPIAPRTHLQCGPVQGISRGWADIYSRGLENQYVNVSGVPNGIYHLEIIIDPENKLIEADETNNIRMRPVSVSVPGARIQGNVWTDVDGDGAIESIAGESPLPGQTIFVDTNGNGAVDGVEPRAVTDAAGNYWLSGLAAGTHEVKILAPTAMTRTVPATTSHSVTVAAGETVTDIDFAVTGTPRVTDVFVSGSEWYLDALNHLASEGLGDAGYRVPTGAAQSDGLPWDGVDRISARFNVPVSAGASDLTIGTVLNGAPNVTNFVYDADTRTATWTLDGPLGTDHVTLNVSDAILDTSGQALDGEWNNGASAISGNGAAGGALALAIRTAVGDADQDGMVTVHDIGPLRSAFGEEIDDANYSVLSDFNMDGSVTSLDIDDLAAHLGRAAPSAAPPATGQRGAAPVTVASTNRIIFPPIGDPATGSFDFRLDTGDGPVALLNYSVRIDLSGTNAGADVGLTGGGPALNAPATTIQSQGGVLTDAGNIDLLPTQYFHGTVNVEQPVIPVTDGAGLMRVDYVVNPGAAFGLYTFDVVSNAANDTVLIADDQNTVIPHAAAPATLIVTVEGDLDGNFVVGTDDLQAVLGHFTQTVPAGDFSMGDGTGDGLVGTDDLQMVLANFTTDVTPAARAAASMAAWHGWTGASSDEKSAPDAPWLAADSGVPPA